MKNDLQAGLQNIIDAINNLIEPKLGSLRYDKTFRAKVISDEGNNVYGVQINGKNYKAVYTGEKIPVGQIVKVKAPLNNFSDIYIETLPGSGSGSAGNYNDLLNKPILNTNNTGTQVPSATETIQGTISLHKVSKTGNYNDLLNKPTLDFIPTSEKGATNGVAGLDENKKVSKSNLPTDTVYDNNYVHTDNNFTTAMKNKLDSVEEGAEPNKIEIIQRNGSVLPINNKIVNVEVPTKTSDLTNDNGFISSIPIASDTILGGIKVGDNLSITADGVLSAEASGTTDYSVLLNKPVLNTANTKSLAIDSNETINGVVSLHKISKTGSYEDLLNKPTIPTKTSDLKNDSGFITNTVNDLTNYYLKSETYTQTEVNNLIGQIKTISIEVVDTLPTTGEDNKIYLVPKEGSTGDVYNEYIWVNDAWELIGSTQVDLTGYATQDWVNNQIHNFLTESQVTEIVNNSLTNYYTKTETYSKTEVNNLLNGKANSDDIPTKTSDLTNDSGFIDNSVDNLENYYKKSETYNQTEINNLLSNKADISDIPTKTGDLTNNGDGTTGSKYITNSDLNTELEGKQDKITGGATTIVTNDLTVNRALVSNANGKVAVSNTTSTELGYLSGARSNLQTQIDAITTEGGQPNVIEVVQENGVPLEITNKTVNVTVPTNLVNGIAEGSLRAIGSKEESSTYSLGKYAFAEGTKTVAAGQGSHSEGLFTVAGRKAYTILLGDSTAKTYSLRNVASLTTGMSYSIKHGNSIAYNVSKITNIDRTTNTITVATYAELSENGNYLFIEDRPDIGDAYISTGTGSHAEGGSTYAAGDFSHAEGNGTVASSLCSHAEGENTVASGLCSHAEGENTVASAVYSHAQGKFNIVDTAKQYAHIVGNGTADDARSNAHTLDWNGNAWYSGDVYVGSTSGTNKDDGSKKLLTSDDITKNIKDGSAEGSLQQINATSATGKNSFAIGYHTQSIGETSVAEGTRTEARGNYSHAEGNNTKIYYKGFTIISGDEDTKTYTLKDVTGLESGMSFMITTERYTSGYNGNTITNVDTSSQTITVNKYFPLFDNNNFLSLKDYPDLGDTYLTKESKAAHAEGVNTLAAGSYSHAEGENTVSAGEGSHSEGGQTKASGMFSHAEGWQTQARGYSSHSEGHFTISNADYQHVQGKYNIADDTSLDIIGNGTGANARSNAYTLDRNGNAWYSGDIYIGSTSGTNKDAGSKKVATEEYVDNKVVTDYDKLTNRPTLNTNVTTSQPVSESEIITGKMVLHKISKTGNYNDLNNKLNIINGSAMGSLKTIGATVEDSKYKLGRYAFAEGGRAIGFQSHSEGHSQTGRYCFAIVSGDSAAKTYTLSSVTGLSVNMKYSIHMGTSGAIDTGIITAIDTENNVVTVNYYEGLREDNNYFYIYDRPDIGDISYIEASNNGTYSHAEGTETYATGDSSHTEGWRSKALGDSAHAEGYSTIARGDDTHAEGYGTQAIGWRSHAEGKSTIANGNDQHVQGKYNIADTTSLDIIGNGKTNDNRSNAYTLDTNGNAWYSGEVYVGSTSGTHKDSGSKKLITLGEIPIASSKILGLVKVGSGLGIGTDGTLNVTGVPVVLYSNNSGSNGTITLSQTAANFSYLEIIYFDDHSNHLSTGKISAPNGKIVVLSTFPIYSASNTVIANSRRVTISSTSISTNNSGDYYGVWNSWNNSISATNNIKIIKVLGYK